MVIEDFQIRLFKLIHHRFDLSMTNIPIPKKIVHRDRLEAWAYRTNKKGCPK